MINRFFKTIVYLLFLLAISGCEEKTMPVVETDPAENISATSVILKGNIPDDGGEDVTSRGFRLGTTNPPLDTDIVKDGGSGSFTASVSDLLPATTYYAEAYAINSVGEGKGDVISFLTQGAEPETVTQMATEITTTTVTLNGSVNPNHLATKVTFEYGSDTQYGTTINSDQDTVRGESSTMVSANLTGLDPGSTYHFRVKAESALGITYGDDMTFTMNGALPDIGNPDVIEIGKRSATISVSVNANYLDTEVDIEYGVTTDYGSTGHFNTMVTGNNDESISVDISGLDAGTRYYYRIRAENILGVSYSENQVLETLGSLPEVDNWYVDDVKQTTARIYFDVNPGSLSTVINIEYGYEDIYGNNTPLAYMSDSGNVSVPIFIDLNDLDPLTDYHARIKVENELGTAYSEDIAFSTFGSVSDVSGNTYKTVKVGEMVWMAENLRVGVFNDGSGMDFITDDTEWATATSPAYCWYDNDPESYALKYGALYNWMVVDIIMNGSKNVCPTGWHVARHFDWAELDRYLTQQGYGYEGSGNDIAKSLAAQTDWYVSSEEGTPGNDTISNNSSGFSALPAGTRSDANPSFAGLTISGAWWAMPDTFYAGEYYYVSYWIINNFENLDSRIKEKTDGMSIRCVEDY